jgi:HK97 family phage major capsid protein
MKQERARLVNEARALLDKAESEDRELTAEESEQYDRIIHDVDQLGTKADREERQVALEKELTEVAKPAPRLEVQHQEVRSTATSPRGSEEYRQAFDSYLRRGASRLTPEEYRALEVGVDAEGGYLTDDELDRRLVQGLLQNNVMRGLSTVFSTSLDRKFPVVASEGVATWVDEEGVIPDDSDPSFAQKNLDAYKMARILKVSDELLQDALFDIQAFVANQFARSFGLLEEEAFVVGDGSGKPTGITVDATDSGFTVTQSGIVADDFIDTFHALPPQYRSRATWLLHDTTAKEARKQREDGATGNYIWQPGLQAGEPDTILGRPVAISAFMPDSSTSTNKAIVFGDLSWYYVADRQGRTFQRLNELYAATGQVGFRATQRVDAVLILPEAVVYSAVA